MRKDSAYKDIAKITLYKLNRGDIMARKLKEKVYLRFAERKSWVKAVYIDNTEYINIGFKTTKGVPQNYKDEKGRKENK